MISKVFLTEAQKQLDDLKKKIDEIEKVTKQVSVVDGRVDKKKNN